MNYRNVLFISFIFLMFVVANVTAVYYGENVTDLGDGWYEVKFLQSGTWNRTEGISEIDILVVAGGGGAGDNGAYSDHFAGGGGAGGLIFIQNYTLDANTSYTITVGAGGGRGEKGGDSKFNNVLIATGGGYGSDSSDSTNAANAGGPGGSGGGGAVVTNRLKGPGGATTQTVDNDGYEDTGFGYVGKTVTSNNVPGGGGGAGGPGLNYYGGPPKNIWGANYSKGGDAKDASAEAGTANTGNGGDGTSSNDGVARYGKVGGSGIIIIRYLLEETNPVEITIVSPTNTAYEYSNILLNITNQTEVDEIWYNWNGTNVTYTTPVTITFPAGEHTLYAWANNTSGEEQELSVTFGVFTPPTQSNITQPEDKIYGHSVELEWTESTVEYGNIDYYNVIFVGSAANYSVYNGLDLDTAWDVRSIPDQEGYLNMEVCSDFGLCTESQTSLFNITNFNVTINEPSVNATFTNDTYFEFERDGSYNLWCDLYADDVKIRSKSLTSGTNIWNATLNLDGYDDLRVDCNIIGYTSIMSTFDYPIDITEVPYILDYEMTLTEYGSVYDASQVLFYDHNGYLNLLFFSVLSSTDYLNVLVLNGSDILYEHQEPLDLTMSYINVFLEPAQTTLLLVNSTGNGIHWVNVTDTSMTIDTEAFGDFTIVDRTDKFEPAQLVNTHGNVGVAGGYFVVGLPSSTTNYKMYRKNVSDNTLTYLSKDVRGYSVSSSLKSSDFLEWYVAGGDSASTSNLRLDYYNSTAWVNVYSTAVGTEVFTNANYKTKVRFTENNLFLTQLGSSARPFKILNLTSATGHYTSNIQVYNNTLPIYVTDDIFVMLLNSNAGERYYVCEGQDSITCDVVTPSDYGFTVPFTDYPLSANYINSNGINKVTYGKTFSGYPFTFNYNENIYDAKFQCLDEMEEHNLDFVFTVSTDITNNQLATKLIGYVIPSSIMPSGRKDFNVLCDTSVYRKYYLGLDTNYLMNFYGLNESDGLYYTIEVIDAFSNPIPGVLISAKRYSGGELSFVTIEQGVTDTNGNVILFLEPTIIYKINVIDLTTNILITEFDLVPGTTTNIQLKVDTSERLNLDDPSQMFDDVVWLLTPKPTTFRNSTEVEYSVSSASSSLEYSGFYITKTNATGSYVVYNNSGTSPTTQTYSYLFNETGKYEMTTYFKHSNYSTFFSHYSYIYAGNSTFILAQESFEDFNISGWAYFLIVLVVVGMVMGYVSRYSWEGASAVGILVMWAMVIFAPSDMTLVSRGVGTPYEFTISLIHVVSILTLLVGVLLFRRYRA